MIAIRWRSRLLGSLLVALLALSSACAHDDGGTVGTDSTRERSAVANAPALPSSPTDPYNDDVGKLRIRDRAESATLVSSDKGAFITVGEFNAWLGSYPLRVTGDDLASARQQALEQMVRFKLLVASARAAGYEDKLGPGSDQKALALAYLRDQISDVGSISNDAANRYEAEHPELFAQLGTEVPPQVRMMAVKGSLRGEQLRSRIQDLETDAGIQYELPRDP